MSDQKNTSMQQINNQNEENNYALQMQIIGYLETTNNNLKKIIIGKDSEIQKVTQDNSQLQQRLRALDSELQESLSENSQLKQQIMILEKQIQQQQQVYQQDNSNQQNQQAQYQKVVEELKKFKLIFNQNSNPDIVMESLQIKEQMIILQQQKNKFEIELKEAQTRLVLAEQMIQELKRENYSLKQLSVPNLSSSVPQMQVQNMNQQQYMQSSQFTGNSPKYLPKFRHSINSEENQRKLRIIQLKTELRQIPLQNRSQVQQRRVQQIEDELNYLDNKLQQNWDKLQKLCSNRKPSTKRSASKEQKSIPNLQSSRTIQRRASQQDLVYKVVECSTQDIETKNSKQQLDIIFSGLNGLLGYELIMKKNKLDELLKKLKFFLYCDVSELSQFHSKLGNYIINPKLFNLIINPLEDQPSKDIYELLVQELQLQVSKRKQLEWNYQSLKEKRKLENLESQSEIQGLKQAISLLEQQNQSLQTKMKNDQLTQQYEELRRFNKALSLKNDDLYFQNLTLLEKLQDVYKHIDIFQTDQLLFPYLFDQQKYDEMLVALKNTVEDLINLDIKKPEQFIDIDFREKIQNMTPRPNYEYLIAKYNCKSIKQIRTYSSTNDIVQYLVQQLYQNT